MKLAAKLVTSGLAGLALVALAVTVDGAERRADSSRWTSRRTGGSAGSCRRTSRPCGRSGRRRRPAVWSSHNKAAPYREIRSCCVARRPRAGGLQAGAARDPAARGRGLALLRPTAPAYEMRYLYVPLRAPDGGCARRSSAGSRSRRSDAFLRGRPHAQGRPRARPVRAERRPGRAPRRVARGAAGACSRRRCARSGTAGRAAVGSAGRDELGDLAEELNAVGARLAARERLRHADRLKTVGQLASGVAHELGTPLNVISGRAQDDRLGRSSTGDEAAGRTRRIIAEQAARMTAHHPPAARLLAAPGPSLGARRPAPDGCAHALEHARRRWRASAASRCRRRAAGCGPHRPRSTRRRSSRCSPTWS